MNAAIMPTISTEAVARENAIFILISFSRLAPNITGIPRKKVNSAEAVLEQPNSMAPRIVAPDREVPGIRARSWNRPI